MSETIFLSVEVVLALHGQQMQRYGGDPGLRDLRLLEAALAMPQQAFAGQLLHRDIPSQAAAYLFHLVRNHPFLDGNKRTGLLTALTFLSLNGYELNVEGRPLTQFVLGVASSQIDKSAVIDFFARHSAPVPA